MKYFSIIVSFNPDHNEVLKLVAVLSESDIGVVIYDNTPELASASLFKSVVESHNFKNVTILNSNGNKGLSTAFNESVQFVRDKHPELEGVFIFDQDSNLTTQVISDLVNNYIKLKSEGIDVGVIGGMPIDPDNKPYHFRTSRQQSKNFENSKFDKENIIPVEFVISSFSLVPMSTFEKIGLFEKDYFIDLIDNEFCFRCIKYGLGVFMIKSAKFQHVVGSARISIFGRLIAISSPFRNYYQFRNPIFVAKKYGWYVWCIRMLAQRFVQITLSGFRESNVLKRYKFALKGIIDGINSRGGEYK